MRRLVSSLDMLICNRSHCEEYLTKWSGRVILRMRAKERTMASKAETGGGRMTTVAKQIAVARRQRFMQREAGH